MAWALGISVSSPSAFLLGIAAVVASLGGILSTVMAAHRARSEEQQACEEKLRMIRLEAGNLAQELYVLKTRKETP